MAQFTSRQIWSIIGLAWLIILVSLGSSNTGRRLVLSAVKPFAATWDFLGEQMSTVFDDEEAKDERIRKLEEHVSQLKLQANAAQELQRENQQLRRALALGKSPEWRVVQAEILTRDPAFWDLRFTINRGSSSYITQGSIVLYGDALVGRVTTVNQHNAIVETIISPSCRIGVVLDNSENHGLLRGMGLKHAASPGCLVDFLSLDAQADVGDKLVTSGIGGIIPPGIPVAIVAPDKDGSSIQEVEHARKKLLATPVANWNDMRFVTVVVQTE